MNPSEPKDGDYASMLDAMANRQSLSMEQHVELPPREPAASPAPRHDDPEELTPEQIAALIAEVEPGIIERQGRTKAELDALAELQALPELSEEELARQALAHPGADDDPRTAE